MVLKKSPVRGYTPEPFVPEPKPDYSAIDYNRSTMYQQLLHKKNIKYYRDTKGVFHVGTMTEPDSVALYKSDSDLDLDESTIKPVDARRHLDSAELGYYINLFKNPATIESGKLDIDSIYGKARTALKLIMKDLLLKDQFHFIDNQYSLLLSMFFIQKSAGKGLQKLD